jgi:hypothetical protein
MKLLKIALALVIGVPLAFVVLSVALGLMTALVGLAVRVAIVGLILWGAFRLLVALFGGKSRPAPPELSAPPAPVDRYYEAARQELDRELGVR